MWKIVALSAAALLVAVASPIGGAAAQAPQPAAPTTQRGIVAVPPPWKASATIDPAGILSASELPVAVSAVLVDFAWTSSLNAPSCEVSDRRSTSPR